MAVILVKEKEQYVYMRDSTRVQVEIFGDY